MTSSAGPDLDADPADTGANADPAGTDPADTGIGPAGTGTDPVDPNPVAIDLAGTSERGPIHARQRLQTLG